MSGDRIPKERSVGGNLEKGYDICPCYGKTPEAKITNREPKSS
jgi:hypothetical protein